MKKLRIGLLLLLLAFTVLGKDNGDIEPEFPIGSDATQTFSVERWD